MEQKTNISVKDFSQDELRKWQLKLLEILVYFRDFCESHHLRFFLSAGTCLGAIRHHGFIPWDDDLDVIMPRSDYMKLIEIWNKEADTTKFECCFTTKDTCIRFPMATIRSKTTTCIYNHSINDDINQGLKIDVEFLDGVSENRFARFFNEKCALLLALFRAQRVPERRASSIVKIGSKILLMMIPNMKLRWIISRWCERRVMSVDFDSDCKYVRYSGVKPFLKEAFEEAVFVDFEGYKMPIPKGYDNLLKTLYGDYSSLPPEEQRFPATDNLYFYDLDHGYLNYRGKYYCVNNK